jgi:hypothetical protein
VKAHVVPEKFMGIFVRSHDNVTFEAVPAVKVAIIVAEPEFPGVSVTLPELERV